NTAYVLNLEDRARTQYQIVRMGDAYRDPDDNDVIGYEAQPVGDTEVRAFGDPATIYIVSSQREARPGDHLLPVDENAYAAQYFPHAPERRIEGSIIAVYSGMTQIGQYQIVALNRGSTHGLEQGHVLTVHQTGRKARDPYSAFGSSVRLSENQVGTVLVFQVRPRLSYALVMAAQRPIHVLDKVAKPDRAH
ncbi:MAG TPA: hypothetical protein VM369_04555, partial [Candidatus Binatia bacterium]|nr:hypothetical protein [Candidatus Binatia bacterium]